MKLNGLALIIVLFIIISFILLTFHFISIAFTTILAYSLLVIGVALVYTETIRQNGLSVFLGSIIFLFGMYFLITENFNLSLNNSYYIPLSLIFGGTGLLLLFISNTNKKMFLYFSIVLLIAGGILLIIKSHWGVKTFFLSIVPVLNYLWPVLIVFIILVFIMKVK